MYMTICCVFLQEGTVVLRHGENFDILDVRNQEGTDFEAIVSVNGGLAARKVQISSYLHIYIFIPIHFSYVYIPTYTYIFIHGRTLRTYVYVHTSIHTYTYTHIGMHKHTHRCGLMSICRHISKDAGVFVHVNICTYIQTYDVHIDRNTGIYIWISILKYRGSYRLTCISCFLYVYICSSICLG